MASSNVAVLKRASKTEADEFAGRVKKPVQISGGAVFDPESGELEGLIVDDLVEKSKVDALRISTHKFFHTKSLEQQIKEQGVKPIEDFGEPSLFENEDELDEFLEAIYSDR